MTDDTTGGPLARPSAEQPIDAELAAALVAAQHPDLAGPVRLVADGWDNVILRLGTDWALRLPRREQAVALLLGEQRWLGELASRLPVPVPVPVRIGRPGPGYPWPWSILRWIDGADALSLPAAGRLTLAGPLAAFVTALHVPAPNAPDLPRSRVRGVPLAVRDASVRENLARLPAGLDAAALGRVWADALDAPARSGPPRWVHGDLHPGNLLVDASGGLAAVIDFGDLTVGDPATDLATAWLTFDETGRAAFRAALAARGPVDPATWRRARGWAVATGSALAVYSADDPRMAAVGRHALTAVLAEAHS